MDEAARVLSVHRNTIREWIRRGLPIIDQRRPILILGRELGDFLTRRRSNRKRPCGAGQIYCVRCRCPQQPAGNMADYQPVTATSGNLVGICPACETFMYRRVSLVKLDAIRGSLEVGGPAAGQRNG